MNLIKATEKLSGGPVCTYPANILSAPTHEWMNLQLLIFNFIIYL